MRVRAQVRQTLGPLTLTLSQRERGHERMAKQVPGFCMKRCTTPQPQAHGYLSALFGSTSTLAYVIA